MMNKGKKRKKQKRPPAPPPEPVVRPARRKKELQIEPEKKGVVDLFTVLFIALFLWAMPDLLQADLVAILWYVAIMVAAIYLLISLRKVKKQDVFAALAVTAVTFYGNAMTAMTALPAFLGACAVFRAREEDVPLPPPGQGKAMARPLLLSAAAGVVMGGAGLLVTGTKIAPSFTLTGLMSALNIGITDEVIFRFFLLALCLHIVGRRKPSRAENVFIYLIMIIPYVLIHFTLFSFHPVYALFLGVGMALPLTVIMRKYGLACAVAAQLGAQLLQFILTAGV